MRLPPNLKYFLFFILAIGLIVLGTIYLPRLIPGIGKILTWILIGGMMILIFFTLLKPMFTFLYARADGILKVYVDQRETGFHLFTYHLNSGGEYSSFGTRTIQHYFIIPATGKLLYKIVFAHSMEPMSGRSGWGGFTSFEESVLTSPMFDRSIAKLSAKAGYPLQLGKEIATEGDDHFSFEMNGLHLELKKYENAADLGVSITCTSVSTRTILWKKKI